MLKLKHLTRQENLKIWDEHFKTILLLLLETLGDIDVGLKMLKINLSFHRFWQQ